MTSTRRPPLALALSGLVVVAVLGGAAGRPERRCPWRASGAGAEVRPSKHDVDVRCEEVRFRAHRA